MKPAYISQTDGAELHRKYAYLTTEQWAFIDKHRATTGISVSLFIGNLINNEAAKAKEHNDKTKS